MRYIDTHSHLNLEQFDNDREEVMTRMRAAGVATVTVGVDFATSKKAVELAEKYPDVILGATIGVHPIDSEENFDPAVYAPLLASGHVVAVGECGLDYFRTPRDEAYERQKSVFEKQLAFAIEHNLPMMLHVRPSKGTDDAHDDAIQLLEALRQKHGGAVRGTAHFFTASLAAAQKYWNIGFATSFPGVITFAKETEAVVRAAPKELMLAETDAPFAAPVPYRGQCCEPTHVIEVVKKISQLRGEEEGTIEKQLIENAQRIFKI